MGTLPLTAGVHVFDGLLEIFKTLPQEAQQFVRLSMCLWWFQENSEVSSSEFFTDTQARRRTGSVVGVWRNLQAYKCNHIISLLSKTCLLQTTGKESGLLFTDKTSKLFSKSESQKQRSAPVRSFRPDVNEVPSNVKVLMYCTTLKIKAGWDDRTYRVIFAY